MSIQNATLIKKGLAFGGTIPDYSSAIGYKESIGDTCKNPNGYTVGSFFVGSNDGYFYKVTSAIAYGDTLTVGVSGNCEQTSVAYELANNSGGDTATVRYNENTDRLEVLLNGTWVQSIKAYANNLILFDGTSFYATYDNGVYNLDAGNYTLIGGFTINLPNFIAPVISSNGQARTFNFADSIDMTDYSSVILETSAGTITVDVTNVNQSAYIFIDTAQYGNTHYFTCRICSQKSISYDSYVLTKQNIIGGSAVNDIYITNIRLVK